MSFRIEKKIFIKKINLAEFKKALFNSGVKTLFQNRKVQSIYFDNINKQMYLDSIEGLTPRKKIRVRNYPDTSDVSYKLETKISSVEGRHKIAKKISDDYFKKKQPLCMVIPTKPVKGLSGDFIFRNNKNIVSKLSRNKESDIYCTGIQVLNPKKINDKVKKTDDFNILWKRLIKKKQLYVSNIRPKRWFTVDNIENYKNLKKKFK